jgi:hypothetical protein
MYTKKQLDEVAARVEKDGMAGLLRPPPLSTKEKLSLVGGVVFVLAVCGSLVLFLFLWK